MPNKKEPLSIVLPWNLDQAIRLQQGMRDARQKGTGLRAKLSYEESLDRYKALFYSPPQKPFPNKPAVKAPQQYNSM